MKFALKKEDMNKKRIPRKDKGRSRKQGTEAERKEINMKKSDNSICKTKGL